MKYEVISPVFNMSTGRLQNKGSFIELNAEDSSRIESAEKLVKAGSLKKVVESVVDLESKDSREEMPQTKPVKKKGKKVKAENE